MRNLSHFADSTTPAQSSGLASLLAPLTGDISSQLPSQQQIVTSYVEAIVAFWVVGGITLFVVNKLSK